MKRLLFSSITFFIFLNISLPCVLGDKSFLSDILAQSSPSLSTQDGLTIEISSLDSSIRTLRLNAHDVSFSLGPSGFSIKNFNTQTEHRFQVSSTETAANRITQIADAKHESLRLEVNYLSHSNYIEVNGILTNFKENDKAVILNFALPVEAINWNWEKDILSQETIKQGEVYQTTQPLGDERRQANRYPFSSISKVGLGGLSIAVPTDWPRVYRTQYNAAQKTFLISFDFGLTSKTTKFPNQASFKFIIYTHDPKWGFRATAQKYYEIFPRLFANRLENEQGEWINVGWNTPLPSGFGIKYHEIDTKFENRRKATVESDKDFGGLSFIYHMPGRANVCLVPDSDNNTYCDCSAANDNIEEYKNIIDQVTHQMSPQTLDYCNSDHRGYAKVSEIYRSVYHSGLYDENGNYISPGIFNYLPYPNTRIFYVNPDPEISEGKIFTLMNGINQELKSSGADGIYLDNLYWKAMEVENYREEHFKYSDHPLAFSYKNGKPTLIEMFSMYEFLEHLSSYLHEENKYLMTNLNPSGTNFYDEVYFAHLLDVVGGEASYVWGYSNVFSDEVFALHRTIAYQKPYTLLTRCHDDKTEREDIAKRALFFGIFPGNSVHTGSISYPSEQRCFNFEEVDRNFYQKFSSIEEKITEAGWEPITYAVTHGTLVERFGQWENSKIYFTLRNNQNNTQQDKLVIDMNALGISSEDKLSVTELFSASQLNYNFENSKLTIPFSIAAEDTIVLDIKGESTSIPGDANGDGRVDSEDFALLVEDYLREPVHNTDFNSDGRVDSEDFAILQANYLD